MPQAIQEKLPVREIGYYVVEGLVLKALLSLLALGDVLDGGDAHCASPVTIGPPSNLKVQRCAVLPDSYGLVGLFGTGSDLLTHQIAVLWCHELHDRPAGHIRWLVAEHINEGAICLHDVALVANKDALEGRV